MVEEPKFYFDPETQREVLHNVEDAEAWVEHLTHKRLAGDPTRVVWLRILGRLEEAEDLGWLVLERAGGPRTRTDLPMELPLSSVTAAIRLAHVLQWRGKFPLAHELHAQSLETLDGISPQHEDAAYADYLRPFAYQHLARCYFDQGEHEKALTAARQAWELRVNAGVPEDQTLSSSGMIEVLELRVHSGAD